MDGWMDLLIPLNGQAFLKEKRAKGLGLDDRLASYFVFLFVVEMF